MPKPMYDRNGIALYHGDCADILPALGVKADLIVTSPPYDSIRDYGGQRYDFESCAAPIANALADGGVMCWHTNDMVIDGGYSGSSFDAALWFMREAGLRMHDRIIVDTNAIGAWAETRYIQSWAYCWVFSKGKPKTASPIADVLSANGGQVNTATHGLGWRNARRKRERAGRNDNYHITPKYRKRNAVWRVLIGDNCADHPAPMPMALATDLIRTYSNAGDLILDPFSGSATTAYAAQLLDRRAVGVEIHKPYIEGAIAKRFLRQPLFAGVGD